MIFLKIIILIIFLLLLGIAFCYLIIKWIASPSIFSDAEIVPEFECTLILGTAKFTQKGGINLFYKYRMDAAEILF